MTNTSLDALSDRRASGSQPATGRSDGDGHVMLGVAGPPGAESRCLPLPPNHEQGAVLPDAYLRVARTPASRLAGDRGALELETFGPFVWTKWNTPGKPPSGIDVDSDQVDCLGHTGQASVGSVQVMPADTVPLSM
jgi:hypothetical protein